MSKKKRPVLLKDYVITEENEARRKRILEFVNKDVKLPEKGKRYLPFWHENVKGLPFIKGNYLARSIRRGKKVKTERIPSSLPNVVFFKWFGKDGKPKSVELEEKAVNRSSKVVFDAFIKHVLNNYDSAAEGKPHEMFMSMHKYLKGKQPAPKRYSNLASFTKELKKVV